MGKVKKSRTKHHKKPDTEDETLESSSSKETTIQTILDQLQSPNVEEKYCGLQTLAIFIELDENSEEVLRSEIVKAAAPLLLDPANSVRNAAAGSLRNLSAKNLEHCEVLLEQDVMTSLIFYFYEHGEKWSPDPGSKTNEEDKDTLIHCVNLLWNLCESSEIAVKRLDESRILDILPRFLDLNTFGEELLAAVLQSLFVIVEENPLAIEKIKCNCESQLQNLLMLEGSDPSVLLIKTLATGVTINLCNGEITNLSVDVINKLVSILASTLSLDHRLACHQLSSSVPLIDNAGKLNKLEGKEAKVLNKQIKSILNLIEAQQSAVEIIANVCSCDASEDPMDDDSSDSETIDDNICNGNDETYTDDKLLPQLTEIIVSLQIFDKVWARAQLPAENAMLILKEYEDAQLIHKKLYTLQSRALLCINNMLSSLPIDGLGGVSAVYKVWVDAGKMVFKQNADDVTLLESATAVMRAALDKLKITNEQVNERDLFSDMALSDIELMLNGIKDCQVPEIRANLIRMIGILALLFVPKLTEITSNVVCSITEFLLDQTHKETEVWVMAEGLDTIIDLYSEDETDALALKVKLVDKLNMLMPVFKNKARLEKRLPKEYKALVNTVNTNLPRFIKYKKSRIC